MIISLLMRSGGCWAISFFSCSSISLTAFRNLDFLGYGEGILYLALELNILKRSQMFVFQIYVENDKLAKHNQHQHI